MKKIEIKLPDMINVYVRVASITLILSGLSGMLFGVAIRDSPLWLFFVWQGFNILTVFIGILGFKVNGQKESN